MHWNCQLHSVPAVSSFQTCIVFQRVWTTFSTYLNNNWLLMTSVFIPFHKIRFWVFGLVSKEPMMVSFGKSQISVWDGESFNSYIFFFFHLSPQKIRCWREHCFHFAWKCFAAELTMCSLGGQAKAICIKLCVLMDMHCQVKNSPSPVLPT